MGIDCLLGAYIKLGESEMSEWVEINLPMGYVIDENGDDGDSLHKRGLIKPGTKVRMKNGKEYLIGDINEKYGTCGCCELLSNHEIVTHYKILEG